jgi:hypothetical protein
VDEADGERARLLPALGRRSAPTTTLDARTADQAAQQAAQQVEQQPVDDSATLPKTTTAGAANSVHAGMNVLWG